MKVQVSTRSNTKLPSFHTAGCGKAIAVSPTSLQRAAKLLDPSTNKNDSTGGIRSDRCRYESEPLIQNPVPTSHEPMQMKLRVSTLSNTKLPSFHTAGCGKVIAVSPTSLERAANVLDPSTNDNHTREAPLKRTILSNIDHHPTTSLTVATSYSDLTKRCPVVSFQTAGRGDSIRVSDESRCKAALLFHDSTRDKPGPLEEPTAAFPKVAVPVRVVYQTAGRGETITVAPESLEAARSILVDPSVIHMDTTGTHGWGDRHRNAPFDDLTNQPVANRSAHPKIVDARIVGDQESVRDFEIDVNVVSDSTANKRSNVGTPIAAFQTAGSRTKVQVSDESLQKAALILQNGNGEKALEPEHKHLPQTSSQTHTACNVSDQGSSIVDTAALLVRPGVVRDCTKYSSSDSQHTPTAKNTEFELTKGDNNTVTPAIQESNHEFSSQDNNTDTRTFHDHQAPKSCRRSFSVSSMVKGLMPLYEEQRTKSPLPILDVSLRQTCESTEERAGIQLGMSTPAQQSDEMSKYVGKTFVTPGSAGGASMRFGSPFSFPSPSLREAFANGLMISSAIQSCQFGVNEITIEINSLNACQLRFNRTTLLPEALSNHLHDYPDLLGSLSDYRKELKGFQCDILKICDAWLRNHVRWIIWKLASTERKFASYLAGKYLTFDAVVLQLKLRYDKEIRIGKRPAVRRLLNRDISPGCTFILCVAQILPHKPLQRGVDEMEQQTQSQTEPDYMLELTDGWYSLPAMPDYHLCDIISRGTIQVGTKLLVTNSSMTGFDEGIDPLDESFDSCSTRKSPVLHISINSSRLARWNSKLGQVSSTSVRATDGMFSTRQISDVYDCGGQIPLIDLRIIQRFPLSYLDRTTSSSGTRTRILTEREEQTRVEMYEKQRQIVIDEISEVIQAECEKVRHYLSRSCVICHSILLCYLFFRTWMIMLQLRGKKWFKMFHLKISIVLMKMQKTKSTAGIRNVLV